MSIHEIVLPETKPETEWILGHAVRKVSATYWHARLQTLLGAALVQWADDGSHGRVGVEWRFRISPPGKIVRPFVPDVAFLSYEVVARDAPRDAITTPLAAPTVAIEILSPDDRPLNVAHKIATYLAAGSAAIFVVDPQASEIVVHDARGSRRISSGEVSHGALPGFRLDVAALFERAAN